MKRLSEHNKKLVELALAKLILAPEIDSENPFFVMPKILTFQSGNPKYDRPPFPQIITHLRTSEVASGHHLNWLAKQASIMSNKGAKPVVDDIKAYFINTRDEEVSRLTLSGFFPFWGVCSICAKDRDELRKLTSRD